MESFVAIAIIESVITSGVMNQLETGICIFEEKITNSDVQETVDVNSFEFVGDILEWHSKRNINQHIINPVVVPD